VLFSTPCTGEMLCGPHTVLLMDSISTGLDSSTTFDIMQTLKVNVASAPPTTSEICTVRSTVRNLRERMYPGWGRLTYSPLLPLRSSKFEYLHPRKAHHEGLLLFCRLSPMPVGHPPPRPFLSVLIFFNRLGPTSSAPRWSSRCFSRLPRCGLGV